MFEYLADHPDGTRMVELGREFGVAHIQMAGILKNLMGDNKVEERDLLTSLSTAREKERRVT